MSDDPSIPPVREAKAVPKRRTRFSLVWVIPIVAAVAGVWIAVTKILARGPEITITFSSAEGLQANKTRVRFNGLEVGTLTDLRLAADHQHVIGTARMVPQATAFLFKDTKFWVVKPRISGLNVTGLSTLLSGNYIGMQPGQSHVAARHFTALESPPLTGNEPGRSFTLKASELGSLGPGTPVYYRQIQAGQVVSYELDKTGHYLNVTIFVQAPYDKFVTPDTRFWHASGIDMTVSANGFHIQTESLVSILSGGVAFETPSNDVSATAPAGTVFTLFRNQTEALRPPPCAPHDYLLVFKQSVRGLQVGAPVELGGVTIGKVTAISPQFNADKMQFSVPVTISVDPMRYGVKFLDEVGTNGAAIPNKKIMNVLVSAGLRAQLKRGSLLSGALYVAVDFIPNAPPTTLDWSQKPVQLPTVSSQTETLEGSANSIMKSLDTTLAGMQVTLTNANRLLNNANSLVSPDSEFNAELMNLLQQGGGAARSLRILTDYLERHPEAIIRGKPGESQP